MKSSMIAAIVTWMMTCVAIVNAAETAPETSITIKGMHCAGCAKKVTKKLKTVSNVKFATVDSEKGTATVVPDDSKEVSPKALWEAVENTGYKPTGLKGPGGTFTSKPTK